MNAQQTTQFLRLIKGAYPEFFITAEAIAQWASVFQEHDFDAMKSQLQLWINSGKKVPSIAEWKSQTRSSSTSVKAAKDYPAEPHLEYLFKKLGAQYVNQKFLQFVRMDTLLGKMSSDGFSNKVKQIIADLTAEAKAREKTIPVVNTQARKALSEEIFG